jgi:hypothetical protein
MWPCYRTFVSRPPGQPAEPTCARICVFTPPWAVRHLLYTATIQEGAVLSDHIVYLATTCCAPSLQPYRA